MSTAGKFKLRHYPDGPPAQAVALPEGKGVCGEVNCPAGAAVWVASRDNDPAIGCPSAELSDYTAMVLGFLAVQGEIVGHMPNIDPQTGEPEVEGESRAILAALRTKAGVQTFDQAMGACQHLKGEHRYTMLNFKPGRGAQWIGDLGGRRSMWVQSAFIERR